MREIMFQIAMQGVTEKAGISNDIGVRMTISNFLYFEVIM